MPGDKENKEEVSTEDVVKNVSFDDVKKKKSKKNEIEKKIEEESTDEEEDDDNDILDDEDEDEDADDDDDDDDDDDEDDDEAEGITDVGLYNVLGSFLMDEEGNNIGTSLSNIAKELAKLNHLVKKFSKNS
jgi:hypothetical protein